MGIASVVDQDRDVDITQILFEDLLVNACSLVALCREIEANNSSLDFHAVLVANLLQFPSCRVQLLKITRDKNNVEALISQIFGNLFADAVSAPSHNSP